MSSPLELVLSGRDARWNVVKRLTRNERVRAIVTVALNIPGPDKNPKPLLYWRAVSEGVNAFLKAVPAKNLMIAKSCTPAGLWACIALGGPSPPPLQELKTAAERIEASHPLGRVLDIDVINPANCMPLGRGIKRPCIVCGRTPAIECIRKKTHAWQDVFERMDLMITEYFSNT